MSFVLCCIFFSCSIGQTTVNVDSGYSLPTGASSFYSLNGQPYINVKFTKVVEGSPFFIEKWNTGSVQSTNGGQLDNAELRLDLFDQQLHYLKDGNEYVTDKIFKEVRLTDQQTGKIYIFRTGFTAANASTKNYLQVLADGKVPLLKQIRKVLIEKIPLGSSTVEQTIRDVETYYIMKEGRMIKIKREKESLLNALADRQPELEKFIDENKLQIKKEEDMTRIVDQYNSLQ